MRRWMPLCVVGLALLAAGCGVKTNVAVMDRAVLKPGKIHMIVVSDDVDDPLGIGPEIVAAFEARGVSAEVQNAKEAYAQSGSGTGWVVAKGYWVTNNHVVDGLEHLTVSVTGRDIPGTLVATDKHADLAIIQADTGDLRPIKVGTPTLGDEVFVVGYPVPDLLDSHARVTSGVVSSLYGVGGDQTDIQISAPIQPGNSGGPAVGPDWSLSGVVVSTASTINNANRTGTLLQGVNFAVSPNILKGFLLQNGITPEGPYCADLKDVMASTGLVWNGTFGNDERIYIANFSGTYYWDLVNHLQTLRISIVDTAKYEEVLKSSTRAQGLGVSIPVRDAVDNILAKLGMPRS